ncbi:MAG: DNA-directed polymerase [Patescibacteria group bacterium]|jgi:DNA polymerase-4|nr:DNA-directed polymerase [Patescibacteria group bacterium]
MLHKGLQETRNARVLYLDMNSFFASVEQQLDPSLRNIPMAVVSHIANKGTILAASYEAKAFGIRTGTKIYEARQLCPEIKLVEPTPYRYRAVHYQFLAILRDMCGPEVVAKSVDEAAIYLSPNWQDSEQAKNLALSIKERFAKELGPQIRCSIGIAPNSLLAKVASNLQKPDGLTEIRLEDLPHVLQKLHLTDLPGIAERNAARLINQGITTPWEFHQTDATLLQKQFGIWGRYWWWRLHGYETEGEGSPTKTQSHEHVLTKWLYSFEDALPVVERMSDRVAHRLRTNNFQCRSVWISLSLIGAKNLSAECRFGGPTASYDELMGAIRSMMNNFPRPLLGPIRKITIGVNQLSSTENGLQLDLFNKRPRSERASVAIEQIRDKFGYESIQPAATVRLDRKVAKEQLGFGRIKDRI